MEGHGAVEEGVMELFRKEGEKVGFAGRHGEGGFLAAGGAIPVG